MRHVQNAQQTIYERQSDSNDSIHAAVYQSLNEEFQVQQTYVPYLVVLKLTDIEFFPGFYRSLLF